MAAALGVTASLAAAAPAAAQNLRVDLELILAIDTSQSVDPYEGWLQRQGYVRALSDPEVVQSILGGFYERIALTYIEWAGPGLWRPIVDWRVIASADDAFAFSQRLQEVMIARGRGTSITSIVTHSIDVFADNGYDGDRRVIDISGDGPNSSGGIVVHARDAAVAAGITVNGLAINNYDGGFFSLPDLDVYYRECVIGGPAAFVIAAEGFETFADAIRRKLILEIAGIQPQGGERFGAPGVRLAQNRGGIGPMLAVPKYAPECDIGERMRLMDNPGLAPQGAPQEPLSPARP